MRDSLSVEERLALTLRFLATGQAFEDMKFSFTISPSAISHMLSKHVRRLCSPGLYEGKSNIKMFYSNYFYCKIESKTYHECLWNIMKESNAIEMHHHLLGGIPLEVNRFLKLYTKNSFETRHHLIQLHYNQHQCR